MADKKEKIKKELIEEPLIDKSGESLKKLITRGKKQGFLKRSECEKVLEDEKFEDKDEFYSKIENLNIQIYDNDENTPEEEESEKVQFNEKESDAGRADDPVRMYLKEMGNVELLSRLGEIEIAKRIESGKKKTAEAFSKSFISMQSIFSFFEEYKNEERQLRDFVDLDSTFRSINGELDDFDPIPINEDNIFDDDQKDDSSATSAEDGGGYVNFFSNGFKMIASSAWQNSSNNNFLASYVISIIKKM